MGIPARLLPIMWTKLWSTTQAHRFLTRIARPSHMLHLQAPHLVEQNTPSLPGYRLTGLSMLHHQDHHLNGINILYLKNTQLVTNMLPLLGHLRHSLQRSYHLTMIGPSFPIPPYCRLLPVSVMKLAHRTMLTLLKPTKRMNGAEDILSRCHICLRRPSIMVSAMGTFG